MQANNPYTLPTLDPLALHALEIISDTIADAFSDTTEALRFAMILPLDTDQLTEALNTAREALKTAYNMVEELRQARHLDQR